MEGIQTLKGSWPWPWPSIRPYGISSCSSHRPLPIYQFSFKLKKLFVDGRTYGRTDGRTDGRADGRTDIFPLYTIRSLGRLSEVDLKRSKISQKIWIDVNRFCCNVKWVLTPSEWIHNFTAQSMDIHINLDLMTIRYIRYHTALKSYNNALDT